LFVAVPHSRARKYLTAPQSNLFLAAMQTILTPSWIAPVEPARTVLENHSLVIDGAVITGLLPTDSARRQYTDARETLLPGHLLIPGFVNLHTHAAMTMMRGLADDLPLMAWLNDHIWPAESRHMSEAYVFDGTELAAAEMLRSGTTCMADMYFYHHIAARAALKAGMSPEASAPATRQQPTAAFSVPVA
jgi:5-methylthioadenosine/S-adenosylhomocysteine deaminase